MFNFYYSLKNIHLLTSDYLLKKKEENDRKAKEEADRLALIMEKDRIEKSKKEEEERIERKKVRHIIID